jgi:hypothetical protein
MYNTLLTHKTLSDRIAHWSRHMMTLQNLLDDVIQQGQLTPSRIPPMRTAVKQYAAMLSVDPAQCPPEVYHLPPRRLTALIDTKAPSTLSPHAIRNLKNNLRYLLRQGMSLKLIAPLDPALQSWGEARHFGTGWTPQRGEQKVIPPYSLRPLPEPLAAEFLAFTAWSTAVYVPDRPARIHKRMITIDSYEKAVSGVAGFAHRIEGMPLDQLHLHHLTDPELLKRFASWWITQRGKVTKTIHLWLTLLSAVAKHWLKDEPRALAVKKVQAQLPHPQVVHEKRQRWLSLAQLESAALSRYPLNGRRLQDSKRAAWIARRLQRKRSIPICDSYSGKRTAVHVSYSLMLRLLVRIPLRQRNMREMQLHRNLQRLPDGHWQLTFQGDELKIGWRNGRRHEITYAFPPDLEGLLDEWLTVWRPLLVADSQWPFVFVNIAGKPHNLDSFADAILRTTWKFTGIAVNPHTIRDIWATEYIKSTRDIAGAAYMLGNTVQIVLKHYAHLLDAEAEQRATNWLKSQLT